MSIEEGTTVDASGAEARIRQLIAEKKALEAKLAEQAEAVQSADKWRAKYEEAQATFKAEREAARIERDIIAAGVTDAEGIEYVQHAYGKLPADGRPAIGEWLANREGLPRAVRAYMADAPAVPAAPQVAPAPSAPQTTTMPKNNVGTLTAPVAPVNAWTPESIHNMPLSEWKANKAAILATLGAG